MPRIVTKDEMNDECLVVSLGDIEWAQIKAAAALVPDSASFIRSVINQINDRCNPTDVDVHEVIEFVLSARGVSYRPVAAPPRGRITFHDAQSRSNKNQSYGYSRRRRHTFRASR
jgi:hypothetical protein